MPLAIVKVDPSVVTEDTVKKLAAALPEIIAKALHYQERQAARLTPKDVEVEVRHHGTLDLNTRPVEITIRAKEFSERKENLSQRNKKIVDGIKATGIIHPDIRGYVWTILVPSEFENF